jgi:deazaflavin-dependent oxidoreductase (nitroreductase family)
MTAHYKRPGWFTHHVFNPGVALATRLGLSVMGSRVLETKGRRSGLTRRTPVNLLTLDGNQYLVSPRGNGEWVRNVRADDGRLDLLLGHRRDNFTTRELTDDEKVPVLRAYLKRWSWEVGAFFDGVSAASSDEDLLRIAPDHPVFALEARPGS